MSSPKTNFWACTWNPEKNYLYVGLVDRSIVAHLTAHRCGLRLYIHKVSYGVRRDREYIIPGNYSLHQVISFVMSKTIATTPISTSVKEVEFKGQDTNQTVTQYFLNCGLRSYRKKFRQRIVECGLWDQRGRVDWLPSDFTKRVSLNIATQGGFRSEAYWILSLLTRANKSQAIYFTELKKLNFQDDHADWLDALSASVAQKVRANLKQRASASAYWQTMGIVRANLKLSKIRTINDLLSITDKHIANLEQVYQETVTDFVTRYTAAYNKPPTRAEIRKNFPKRVDAWFTGALIEWGTLMINIKTMHCTPFLYDTPFNIYEQAALLGIQPEPEDDLPF